jgi:hypothetical protein
MTKVLKNRLTTVFPRQGHYALDPQSLSTYRPADLAVDRIGASSIGIAPRCSSLLRSSCWRRSRNERDTTATFPQSKPLAR